ncbi:lysophospholipid transporter LplT [Chitinibacteraceae bacterium HSL-7]
MDRGFYLILLAQFLSALADNALFIAAFSLLRTLSAPEWHLSMLLWSFTVSYVVLAPFAGAFADSMHKGRVMLLCNGIKMLGCGGMLIGLPPILSYALVGFGAAAYSPAKYGLITEYLPHNQLVAANGWLEGTTVGAIILGTLLGGWLVGDGASALYAEFAPHTPAPYFAIAALLLLYGVAALINLAIPKLNVVLKPFVLQPAALVRDFSSCWARLWRDPQGQLSMAVTTLFWGAGATMRLVVLNWAAIWLAMNIESSTRLIALVALGTAIGAALAGRYVALARAFAVLPAGVMMGALLITMLMIHNTTAAAIVMIAIGMLGGFFVVPLNAMLQHRGFLLMGAGHSIAVQNFNENLGILVMVGLHAWLVSQFSTPLQAGANDAMQAAFAIGGVPPMYVILTGFGGFVMLSMLYIIRRYRQGLSAGVMHD